MATYKTIMAEILYKTGAITKTSSNSCVVSTTIDGSSKSFTFQKSLFYTFGVQCEGDMTNILENGTEVEFCYKIPHPAKKPCIVAVWIGEKPDFNEDMAMVQPIYDIKGQIVESVDVDNFLVEDADKHVVHINKDVVFMNGDPLEAVEALGMQREIVFDAIPCESEHPSGASYQATCAWIGPKPRLLDRFNLESSEYDCGFSGGIVEGTVAVIPNDVVALVDVASESASIKVLLFRSSFKQGCTRILDLINVGDTVFMRLGSKLVFPRRKWWYALEASKTRDGVSFDANVNLEGVPEVVEKNDCERTSQRVSCQPHVESKSYGDVLYNVPPLCGVISLYYRGACITYGDLKIFVDRDDFYVSNRKCFVDEFLAYASPGNNMVYFEAISLALASPYSPEKERCTHEATCAWIGYGKPTVEVLAATLSSPSSSLLKKKCETFYGVVFKYLSPFMAFVFIPGYSAFVVIDANNFVTPPQYPSWSEMIFITNHVKIHDRVEFKLKGNPRNPALFLTYDVRRTLVPEENFVLFNRRGRTTPTENAQTRTKPRDEAPKVAVSVPVKAAPIEKSLLQTFSKKYPPQGRSYVLNCVGVLNVQVIEEVLEATVTHKFGTYNVNMRQVKLFSKDAPLTSEEILQMNKRKVRFDAELNASFTRNSSFEVVDIWPEKYDRPKSELLLASELVCEESRESFYSIGVIKSIPLYDSAIAIVDNAPVLVTLSSLVSIEQINLNVACIETYLRLGDKIFAKIEKRELKGVSPAVSYLRAVKCFPGENIPGEINWDAQLEMYAPQPRKWVDTWGLGEWYRKGELSFEKGKYFVKFVSQKRPDLELNLNLFEKGQVFIDGKAAYPGMLEVSIGKEITFHVAQESSDNLETLFVAFAWIGAEPAPWVLLKERLVVPEGLVSSRPYEVVIDSFPLPSHAICYINHVPLVARILSDYDVKCDIIKDIACECNTLKVGDRLASKANLVSVGDAVALRNEKKSWKLKSGKDFYQWRALKIF